MAPTIKRVAQWETLQSVWIAHSYGAGIGMALICGCL